MANEEDNFDIDLYGDNAGEGGHGDEYKDEEVDFTLDEQANTDVHHGQEHVQPEDGVDETKGTEAQIKSISSTAQPSTPQVQAPKQAPQQQGVKRKDSSSDHRPLDAGATSAVLVSDLQWWHTEDDLRGWANQAQCEDELKDVTFSEHKVNGKSKGQAFLELLSAQAATAIKRKIDSFGTGQQSARKCVVTYTNPAINPFKTLPKDGSQRGKDGPSQRATSGSYNSPNANNNNYGGNNMSGGFRGGRGGYNNRGGHNNMSFNNNRNFSGPMRGGGFQQPQMGGGFQGGNMGGGGMQDFSGGFNNRGGMMGDNMRGGGMRGGRGGMNPGMMPMGNMGNMGAMGMGGIGAMGMGGAMNPMMGMGMQGGFQAGNNFSPGFFNNQQMGAAAGDGSWNPHGAKRTRQE